jgi:hypothetical protein
VRSPRLTDEYLWRAIIQNTNEMSAPFGGHFGARTRGRKFYQLLKMASVEVNRKLASPDKLFSRIRT